MAHNIVVMFSKLVEEKKDEGHRSKIDLSNFLNEINCFTPVQIKYSDPHCHRYLPAAIVRNLASNYGNTFYYNEGMKELNDLLLADNSKEDNKAKQTLLLHLSKIQVTPEASLNFVRMCRFMDIDEELTSDIQVRMELSTKVITHKEINAIINQLLVDYFGENRSDTIADTMGLEVKPEFVRTSEFTLRGFAGIGKIFINNSLFDFKRDRLRLKKVKDADTVISLDIIALVVHELAHIRLRQVMDDFNLSTPKLLAENDEAEDPEFGRMCEKAVFGEVIDWFRSSLLDNFDKESYHMQLLNSIHVNAELPLLPKNHTLIARSDIHVMQGLDVELFEFGFD